MTNLETVLTNGFHIRNCTCAEYAELWGSGFLDIHESYLYTDTKFYYNYQPGSLCFPTYLDFKNYVKGGIKMETKKISINGEFEVPEDFNGGFVDIGTEFTEVIPLNSIVWYWDKDAEHASLGIYKGKDAAGYVVQVYSNKTKVHYNHIKLYKGEGDVE